MLFTDYYAEQSCTAGRSAFITGIHPVRTGLTKVGLPGSSIGISPKDPTLAELLKPHGYVSGQFGKNHLGDRNEFLPTVHGFDEFFGNLYHLNAEEEPENEDYPKDPAFRARFGPRGVLDTKASDKDDPTEDPRFGRVGKQTIKDTGPLTRKRMETADEEFLDRTQKFIRKNHEAGKPWMAWMSTSRMHFYTHLKKESQGVTGLGLYADGMMEHDNHVGQLLNLLDELKIADNTIVVYTFDNGPHFNEWPDGGNTWFRSEKNTNWEGGYRVSGMVRWPGKIKAGTVSNDDHVSPGLGADSDGGRRRTGHQGEAHEGYQGWRQDLQGPSGRLQFPAVSDGRNRPRVRVRSSSTSATTANWLPCVVTSGSWSLPSSERGNFRCGWIRSFSCGLRRSSTCAPIRLSAPTRIPTTTTGG